MFALDKRLLLCAGFVRNGARLADVGSDHAYLPVWLLEKGKISFAVASDINEKPLESGRETAARYGTKKIEFRLGAGLETVKESDGVTDIVIAGMGGELIADILGASKLAKDSKVNLILQPMTRCEKLISFLCENGYGIRAMKCVTEHNKTYVVINARWDGIVKKTDEVYNYVGELDMSDSESRRYLAKIIKNFENKARGDDSVRPLLSKLKEL